MINMATNIIPGCSLMGKIIFEKLLVEANDTNVSIAPPNGGIPEGITIFQSSICFRFPLHILPPLCHFTPSSTYWLLHHSLPCVNCRNICCTPPPSSKISPTFGNNVGYQCLLHLCVRGLKLASSSSFLILTYFSTSYSYT